MRTAALLLLASGVALAQTVAITGVTVVDVATGARRAGQDVVMDAGRIKAVGPKLPIPRSATRINGSGKFLIPGLWDMHAHLQASGEEDLFVAKGVVGVRDMGADADFILPLRQRIADGKVLGPEIVASGPMLDNAPPNFPLRLQIATADQARAAVRVLKQRGVDFLKVHDHTPREVFFAIADEAPKVGLTFSGHVPLDVTVEEAADSGIRSIEHLANYRVIGDCSPGDQYSSIGCAPLVAKLVAKDVWQTPTLAFFQTVADVFSGSPMPYSEYASDSLLAFTRQNVVASNLPPQTLDALRRAARGSVPGIQDMLAKGVRFLAGCDAMVPGYCLHDELERFTKVGFTPLQALQTATINPARFLGREASQGTIDVGKRADVVLLDADPTVDIRNTLQISAVVIRGKLIPKPDLEKILAKHRRKK